jgi:hypothetical protein
MRFNFVAWIYDEQVMPLQRNVQFIHEAKHICQICSLIQFLILAAKSFEFHFSLESMNLILLFFQSQMAYLNTTVSHPFAFSPGLVDTSYAVHLKPISLPSTFVLCRLHCSVVTTSKCFVIFTVYFCKAKLSDFPNLSSFLKSTVLVYFIFTIRPIRYSFLSVCLKCCLQTGM